jgi:hypothetical protein
MRFGDPTQFAIEAFHEPSSAQRAGFGRMCIEIQGVCVGNIHEDHCSLFHAVDVLRKLIGTIETFWDDAFIGLSDAQIFTLLDDALYGDGEGSWERFGRFSFLTNTGEQFDHSKTFIICRPGGLVHVLYRLGDNAPASGSCDIEPFRSATAAFLVWFEDQIRISEATFEVKAGLHEDLCSYSWFKQTVKSHLRSDKDLVSFEKEVIAVLLASEVEIGQALPAVRNAEKFVKFVAWKGTISEKITRAYDLLEKQSQLDREWAFVFCLKLNVDEYEF